MNIFLLSRVMQTKTQMKTPLRFHIRYAVIQPRHKHRKKRTRIWVSVKNEIFPILTSEQSQRTECKQKRDCFSCVQRMQLNANLRASGLVLKKSRVTIMLTQRLFRQDARTSRHRRKLRTCVNSLHTNEMIAQEQTKRMHRWKEIFPLH